MAFTRLEEINNGSLTLTQLLSYPATGFTYFWGAIFFAIWIILASITFFEERFRLGKGNLLSSLAISSFAVMVLSWIGSLVGFVNNEVNVLVTIFGLVFIVIWFIKGD